MAKDSGGGGGGGEVVKWPEYKGAGIHRGLH
jgi:hypothetical protein